MPKKLKKISCHVYIHNLYVFISNNGYMHELISKYLSIYIMYVHGVSENSINEFATIWLILEIAI